MRYLAAKAVVDARAVNREVRRAAAAALRGLARRRGGGTPLRVLEVGSGAGHGFRRWLDLAAPFAAVEYTATDPSDALLAAHREAVTAWARERGYRAADEGTGGALRIEADRQDLIFRFERAAAPAGLDRFPSGAFDLLAAQSVWDLTPPESALPVGRRLLRPGGLFYSALTFCGETSFEPPLPLDGIVLDRYHRSIEARGGDPRAGARLATDAERAGADFTVLASGMSDWRVPVEDGRASDEERVFLSTVLNFIEKEVAGHPEVPQAADWLAARRRALAAGTLRFRAANRDLAAVRR